MYILGVIPSRYASVRFPGKPLAMIDGKSMIQRVYEQALQATSLSDVVVATDDDRIFQHIRDFGGKVMMTSSRHQTGTERCAEVASQWIVPDEHENLDIVVNIQGDEPLIHPDTIDQATACFNDGSFGIATLGMRISQPGDLDNPNVVKVVRDIQGHAVYFSRSCIPYLRGTEAEQRVSSYAYLKHIGIYAYRADVLQEIVRIPPSTLEVAESLEQLRWIDHGYTIKVGLTHHESISVDTPEDLLKLKLVR